MNTRAASVLSRQIARVHHAILETLRVNSSSSPGQVALGSPMMVRVLRCAAPSRGVSPPTRGIIGQDRVEMHRHLRHADALAPRRNCRMQVGQGLFIGEPGDFRHEPVEQIGQPVGAADKGGDHILWLGAANQVAFSLSQPTGSDTRSRHPRAAPRLTSGNTRSRKCAPASIELRAPFGIDKSPDRIVELRGGVVLCGVPCASTKTVQPEPSRRSALFSRAEVATNSAGVAESRSGPRNRAVRCRLPSLFRMTPGAINAAQGRKIGQ